MNGTVAVGMNATLTSQNRKLLVDQGFHVINAGSPFAKVLGSIWGRIIGDRPQFALPVEEQHLNLLRTCHGGVLLTLADMAMSAEASWAIGGSRPCETRAISKTLFRKPVQLHNVLFCHCSTDKSKIVRLSKGANQGRQIVPVEIEIRLGDTNGKTAVEAVGEFVSSLSEVVGYHVLNSLLDSAPLPEPDSMKGR